MIKVLLVDDHDLVRTGMRRLLEDASGIKVVGEAASGEDALRFVRESQPDVVLMDVNMPGIGGLEATRKLQQKYPHVKVLVVSVHADDFVPSRLLQAGATGYITKGADAKEMIQAIHAVKAGQRYISPEIAQKLALMHLSDQAESPFESLSERELQVMMMIIQGQKVQDIADKLCLSSKTVNSYRYRLFDKLGVATDVELTLLALRHGIINFENLPQ